jgi:hypothetical protein
LAEGFGEIPKSGSNERRVSLVRNADLSLLLLEEKAGISLDPFCFFVSNGDPGRGPTEDRQACHRLSHTKGRFAGKTQILCK